MVTSTYSIRTEDQDVITEFEDFCTWVLVVHIVEPRWLLKTSSGKTPRAANRDKYLAELTSPCEG